jgi:hypothetical protein
MGLPYDPATPWLFGVPPWWPRTLRRPVSGTCWLRVRWRWTPTVAVWMGSGRRTPLQIASARICSFARCESRYATSVFSPLGGQPRFDRVGATLRAGSVQHPRPRGQTRQTRASPRRGSRWSQPRGKGVGCDARRALAKQVTSRGRPHQPVRGRVCLTSGMSSSSTGTICSVRSVCALHTTHCRPNVIFRIGLSGNNLWKQSKQIF